MENIATLILTHGLMVVMVWRLVFRDDLDSDPPTGGEGGEPGGA